MKVYIIKRPDYYRTTPYATAKEAKAALKKLNGTEYHDNAWGLYEYEVGRDKNNTVGASVCIGGKYQYLEGNELEMWQSRKIKPIE